MNDSDRQVFRQREFLRLAISIPVRFMCLPKDGRVPDGRWVAGRMIEIGGGGAAVEGGADADVDDTLSVRFVIPDTEKDLKLYARVVNAVSSEGITRMNIKFVGLSEDDRGAILRYAFREQIRRAKGPVHESDQSPPGVDDDGQGDN
jgi:c-di-GMP-binding flagellar brake protein YcgR